MGRGAELFLSGEAEMWSSKEPALLFLAGFLTLAFTGGGRLAVDALIGRGRRGRRR
jgi:uncharacterized membrane protein YphA (DoxX/SURF4 family)